MATTTVRPKPARTTSKRASSANANVNSNTTLTLHLNVNADARSRATNIAGTSTTQRAKPQGGQARGQNRRPAQTTTSAANSPPNQPRQSRPRAQQTNHTGASPAGGNGNGHHNAPRSQQQRQSGSGQGAAGARSGNRGNGYVPRATSAPRQQPPWQDAQRLTSTTGAVVPASRTLVVGNGRGRRA